MRPVVAIDGPAGSGKSTLARRLAEELEVPYLNTGLMYRAVAYLALGRGVDPDDASMLARLAAGMTFDLDRSVTPAVLTIDGRAPDGGLESTEVESTVSRVARHPEVRAVLRAEQRRLSKQGGVVEGRDIGTVVAPDAAVKIFLRAEQDERIVRRSAERGSASASVGDALLARDRSDATTNPLVPAPDAVAIDTTPLDADEVFRTALTIVRARLRESET